MKRFLTDAVMWASCVVAVVALKSFGVIENADWSLAGGALWFAIRAYSLAEVSSVRKNSEV